MRLILAADYIGQAKIAVPVFRHRDPCVKEEE